MGIPESPTALKSDSMEIPNPRKNHFRGLALGAHFPINISQPMVNLALDSLKVLILTSFEHFSASEISPSKFN